MKIFNKYWLTKSKIYDYQIAIILGIAYCWMPLLDTDIRKEGREIDDATKQCYRLRLKSTKAKFVGAVWKGKGGRGGG